MLDNKGVRTPPLRATTEYLNFWAIFMIVDTSSAVFGNAIAAGLKVKRELTVVS